MKSIRDKYYNAGGTLYGRYGGMKEQISDEEKDRIIERLEARARKSRRWTLIIFSLATLLFGFLCYKILLGLSYT
jgi:hypothetical protein